MTVLVVGGDYLGNIPQELKKLGFKKIVHWTGRQKSLQNKAMPLNVSKVIVLCDYLNHNLMQNIKQQAKEKGVPILYGKRSLAVTGKVALAG